MSQETAEKLEAQSAHNFAKGFYEFAAHRQPGSEPLSVSTIEASVALPVHGSQDKFRRGEIIINFTAESTPSARNQVMEKLRAMPEAETEYKGTSYVRVFPKSGILTKDTVKDTLHALFDGNGITLPEVVAASQALGLLTPAVKPALSSKAQALRSTQTATAER